jgi:hypothetical protein
MAGYAMSDEEAKQFGAGELVIPARESLRVDDLGWALFASELARILGEAVATARAKGQLEAPQALTALSPVEGERAG